MNAFVKGAALLLAAFMCCGEALAQVPRKINYQGHLIDPGGMTPVTATLSMEFKLYTVAANGVALYSETQSINVNNGVFNVLIGSLTAIPGSVLFDQPYYLGITVGNDAEMTPRQLVAASPYAIRSATTDALAVSATVAGSQLADNSVAVAKLASNGCTTGQILKYNGNAWACAADDNTTPTCTAEGDAAVMRNGVWVCRSTLRYVDNGNGTVTDNRTGLMWEQKLASGNAACTNASQASRDVRCQQNWYTWSAASPFTAPTGSLYSEFLAKLNTFQDGAVVSDPSLPLSACFAGHCDWRIPNVVELQGILLAPNPNCPSSPCTDAMFGPTQANATWTSSSSAGDPAAAWFVDFGNGVVAYAGKSGNTSARAVRGGR